MNELIAIHLYKAGGLWVFDDPAVGLRQEPFVSGAALSHCLIQFKMCRSLILPAYHLHELVVGYGVKVLPKVGVEYVPMSTVWRSRIFSGVLSLTAIPSSFPRYYSPLRLLADLIRFSVALIPNHHGHHPQPARSPALPSKTSSHPVPTTAESSPVLVGIPTDNSGLPHLTTGSALSITSNEAQDRFLFSTACEFAILRVVSFLFPLSCRFGVFSIRLA
jgi:hypothetical protein